jgi:hypothetical protein
MSGSVSAFVADVALEVFGTHFLGQTAHKVASGRNSFSFARVMKARLVDGARASDVAATVIPVKHAGRQDVA